jgi:hypothetical protein
MTDLTAEPSIVPEGIVRARAAFLRDFPALMADRKTRGKYVVYHNDTRIAVGKDYFALERELIARNIPGNASLILEVTAASELEQRIFAAGGEWP